MAYATVPTVAISCRPMAVSRADAKCQVQPAGDVSSTTCREEGIHWGCIGDNSFWTARGCRGKFLCYNQVTAICGGILDKAETITKGRQTCWCPDPRGTFSSLPFCPHTKEEAFYQSRNDGRSLSDPRLCRDEQSPEPLPLNDPRTPRARVHGTRVPVPLSIFLICYNEQYLLPKTWAFYRTQFPSAKFYLLDNWSSDKSVDVARALGIQVLRFGWPQLNGTVTHFPYPDVERNNIHNYAWRQVVEQGTWVITVDMDEYFCASQEAIESAEAHRVTLIASSGKACVANSNRSDLSDLRIDSIGFGASLLVLEHVSTPPLPSIDSYCFRFDADILWYIQEFHPRYTARLWLFAQGAGF